MPIFHSFSLSFIHPSIRSFIYSFIRYVIHSSLHSFIFHDFVSTYSGFNVSLIINGLVISCLFICPAIHSLIRQPFNFAESFTATRPLTHSLTPSCTRVHINTRQPIHSIIPSIQIASIFYAAV